MNGSKENKNIEELINSGSEIAGTVAGGALGFFAMGPLGAAAAGVSGIILAKGLAKLGTELKQRILGNREEVRIGATVSYSVLKIQDNLSQGRLIRNDDFFNNSIKNRSDAEEIQEGILLSSQKEYEEKKLKYLGNLMGNIVFESDVDKALANQLIKLSENLSYNQLCLLNVFFRSGNLNILKLRERNYRGEKDISRKLITILYDIIDLENKHLLINSTHHVFGLTDIIPSEFSVHGNGNALIRLMELKGISDEDCCPTIIALSE